MIGKNNEQSLVTIVERKSKFTVMRKVENKTVKLVATTIELFRPLQRPHSYHYSRQWQRVCLPEKVAKALECDYYFAHPCSSWEFTERSAKRAKGLLNRRPRKTLGFATPTEVVFREFTRRKFCVSRLNPPTI